MRGCVGVDRERESYSKDANCLFFLLFPLRYADERGGGGGGECLCVDVWVERERESYSKFAQLSLLLVISPKVSR